LRLILWTRNAPIHPDIICDFAHSAPLSEQFAEKWRIGKVCHARPLQMLGRNVTADSLIYNYTVHVLPWNVQSFLLLMWGPLSISFTAEWEWWNYHQTGWNMTRTHVCRDDVWHVPLLRKLRHSAKRTGKSLKLVCPRRPECSNVRYIQCACTVHLHVCTRVHGSIPNCVHYITVHICAVSIWAV
jgi:hypothetical protein